MMSVIDLLFEVITLKTKVSEMNLARFNEYV